MQDILSLIENNMSFLRGINKEESIGSSIMESIHEEIQFIEKNLNNKEVKLAVLGEFSSGKSTLINAILKQDVLSVSDEPTTAVNTYVRYGPEPKSIVTYRDAAKEEVGLAELERFLRESVKVDNVDSVTIFYPNEILKSGLVIVDTPGANVDLFEHNIQRQRAVDEANASIFVISIQSLTSKSFLDFLDKNREKLSKFIFILNKCDTLEDDIDDEPESILDRAVNYAKRNIGEYGGIHDPKIFPLSAYYIIKNKGCSFMDNEKNFSDFLECMDEMMKNDKNLLILFNILKFQKELFLRLMEIVSDQTELYQLKLEKAVGERIDIKGLENQILQYTENNLESEIEKLKESYPDIHKSKFEINLRKIKYMMNHVGSISVLKKEGPKALEDMVEGTYKEIYKYIDKSIDNILQGLEDYMKNNYKGYYDKLQEYYENIIREESGAEESTAGKDAKSVPSNEDASPADEKMTSHKKTLFGKFFSFFKEDKENKSIDEAAVSVSEVVSEGESKRKGLDFNFYLRIDDLKNINIRESHFKSSELESAKDGNKNALGAGAALMYLGAAIGGPAGAVVGAALGGIWGLSTGSNLATVKNEYLQKTVQIIDKLSYQINNDNLLIIEESKEKVLEKCRSYMDQVNKHYAFMLNNIMNYQRKTVHDIQNIKEALIALSNQIEHRTKDLEVSIFDIKEQLKG